MKNNHRLIPILFFVVLLFSHSSFAQKEEPLPCSSTIYAGPYTTENGEIITSGCFLGHKGVKSDVVTFTCPNWDPTGVGYCNITKVAGIIWNQVSGDNENALLSVVYLKPEGGNIVTSVDVGNPVCLDKGNYYSGYLDTVYYSNVYEWVGDIPVDYHDPITGESGKSIILSMGDSAQFFTLLLYKDNSDYSCSGSDHCVVTVFSSNYISGGVGVYYRKCCPTGYYYNETEKKCKKKPWPDLTITQASISQDGKTISYTLENIGKADAPSSSTALYINRKNENLLTYISEPSIPAGSYHNNSYTLSSPLSPGDVVKVCADGPNEIDEEDEDNNCKQISYNTCTDSDNGRDYETKGTCTCLGGSYTDYCKD